MGKYTRRQFITSAGVGMAAVAGLGLAGCAPQTPADKAMANTGNGGTTFADTIAWDGEYDVVVIGFGGAGAVSACYAADAGAKVLLIDKAPQGMEGGNTRFCGQIILNSDDKEAMLAYNKAMAGDFAVDDELMDAYAEGLTQTKTMLRDFFGVPEENFLDWKEDSSAQPMIAMFVPEYPELEGGDALHVLTVSDNVCNSALWKTYRNKVMSMSDNIDVWYMSPATKLFQDPVSRAVIGVEIDKAGETVNIRAKNGVVMTMGGFENNKQMVEDIGSEDFVSAMNSPGNSQYMMYGYVKGRPLNALWGFKYGGVWHNQEEIERNKVTNTYVSATTSLSPGLPRYIDTNNDGSLDQKDLVYLGNADPTIYGGLQNTFNIGQLKVGVYFAYSLGGKIYNYSELYMAGTYSSNQYRYMANSWHPVRNPDSDLPRAGAVQVHVPSDLQVHDASYLRLKNVSVGYTFDLRKRVKWLRDITLSVSGENLYLWSKYNGFDPDVSTSSESSTLRRVDMGAYPRARTVIFSVQIRY